MSSRRYRLTPAGLRSLREAVHRVRPWEASTGPRTAQGKERSRMNAWRHGERSLAASEQRREATELMRVIRRLAPPNGPEGGPPME